MTFVARALACSGEIHLDGAEICRHECRHGTLKRAPQGAARNAMRTLILFLAALPLQAAWVELHHGPFAVYSDAGAEPARVALNHLEQFRFAVGESVGKPEPLLAWPVTVVVRKPGKGVTPPSSASPAMVGFWRGPRVRSLRRRCSANSRKSSWRATYPAR